MYPQASLRIKNIQCPVLASKRASRDSVIHNEVVVSPYENYEALVDTGKTATFSLSTVKEIVDNIIQCSYHQISLSEYK